MDLQTEMSVSKGLLKKKGFDTVVKQQMMLTG